MIPPKMFPLLLLVSLSEMADLSYSLNQTLFTLTQPMDLNSTTGKPCHCSKPCTNLTLSNSSLDMIPECLPREVEVLDLSFNNLTVIREEDTSELSQLHALNLKHNQISKIDFGSNVLPNLEFLDLSNNRLSVVPECVMLKKIKWLSLAHNPISEIQPYAFTCFPNLVFLNLSFTLLGNNTSENISHLAFALNVTVTQENALKSLNTLDLSGTFFRKVDQEWSKDISHLKELHITRMANLENLDGLVNAFPQLEILNCADSKALSSVSDAMFEKAPNLKYVDFQNCNLTTLSPWSVTSGHLDIDLRGNPLNCNCELSWLLSGDVNVTLIRANETLCSNFQGDMPPPSLLYLFQGNQCQLKTTDITRNEATTETSGNISVGGSNMATSTEPDLQTPHTGSSETSTSGQVLKDDLSFVETITVFKTSATDSDSAASMISIDLFADVTPTTSSSISQTAQESHALSVNDIITSTAGTENAIFPVTPFPKLLRIDSTVTAGKVSQPSSTAITEKKITPLPEIPSDYMHEYEDEEAIEQTTTATTPMVPCDYDHCRHLQKPCFELQQGAECSCPGLTGENVIPDPPSLHEVSQITDTSVQVHWCAPNSVVEKYQLVYYVKGSKNQAVIDNIDVTTRQYTLYNLSADTTYHICAVTANKAGASIPENDNLTRFPCAEIKTKPSYVIILAVLSALIGLFLAVIIVLSLCLYKTCKNSLGNQYDTHLVSYKNPAFDFQLNIPSYN
ncbi:leucine-rich repeat neuronal protein 4 [Spea bombifrons]|uniref:leucine-rich repeat neuronal protein 4 n=1 Tax=Spea bombifrons TaxID=233779 RepID=UPI002349A83E|nr:leucine-rich repeat neuronal protein 4 [Spea bombifrons]